MTRKHIVVVGASFAGFTAALELKEKLGSRHNVTVISKTEQFLFTPSLVWLPFGLCAKEDISFSVRPLLEERGIRFCSDTVTRVDPDQRSVTMKSGRELYDYLVIATGTQPNFAAVPGLGPRGYTQSVVTLSEAERAGAALTLLSAAPGPVVVGGVQGTPHLDAAYEFLLNMASWLKKRGLLEKAPLTYLTFNPSNVEIPKSAFERRSSKDLFKEFSIQVISNTAVQQVHPSEIRLADGRALPFAYAMLMPPCRGIDAVGACEAVSDSQGFVKVNAHCQVAQYPEIFAAGTALTLAGSSHDEVPKTVDFAEESAKTVAHNIVAGIQNQALVPLAPAGSLERDKSKTTTQRWRESQTQTELTANRQGHWARLACEKYVFKS